MLVNEVITEGKHDPNIFKAIFMMGSPGSGKTTVAKKIAAGTGLKMVNSDTVYEWLTMGSDMPIISKGYEDELYRHSNRLVRKQMENYIDGRLGLMVDSTGKNPRRIMELKERLEKLGYETMAVYVNVDIETALNRNEQRRRMVDPNWVREKHATIKNNLGQFQNIFKGRLVIVDNNEGTDLAQSIPQSTIRRFIDRPPRMPQAKQWLGEGLLDPRGENYGQELTELANKIRTEAQPWLREVGLDDYHYRVYRGFQSGSPDYIRIRSPRENRKPVDSPEELQEWMNKQIEEKGLVANRSNSFFVTGSPSFAEGYGEVYIGIPLGPFNYTWSGDIRDWYVYFKNAANAGIPSLTRQNSAYRELMQIENTDNESLISAKKKFRAYLRGDDGSIKEAISTGNEILLRAEEILFIDRRVLSDLLKYRRKELGLEE
jgi:adenylate kinase family enzyme